MHDVKGGDDVRIVAILLKNVMVVTTFTVFAARCSRTVLATHDRLITIILHQNFVRDLQPQSAEFQKTYPYPLAAARSSRLRLALCQM